MRPGLLTGVAALACLIALSAVAACGNADDTTNMTELQRVKAGSMDIVLLSRNDALRHGKDSSVIEFRSDGKLVDVGTVRASANMPMPGMPMIGTIDVQPTSIPGRYRVNSDLSMAGTWRMTIEWDGPAGRGSVSFAGSVQ